MATAKRNLPETGTRSRRNGWLRLTAFLLPMFVVITIAVAKEIISISINSGVSGDADTAWGSFEESGPPYMLCSLIKFDDLPDGAFEGTAIQGESLFTSSGVSDGGGELSWSIRDIGTDGGPGMVLSQGTIDSPEDVPLYPGTIAGTMNMGPTPVPIPATHQLYFCITTTERRVHIPGWFNNDTTVVMQEDGGDFVSIDGYQIAYDLEFEVDVDGQPPLPGDTLVTEIAGFGPGSGGVYFDTEFSAVNLALQAAVGLTIHVDEDDSRSLWDGEFGNGAMVALILGDSSGTLPPSLIGQLGFYYYFGKKSGVTSDDEVFAQSIIFATLPDGRQFGQFLAAKPKEYAQQAGQKSLLFTTHDPSRYRVNVGLSSVADGTEVRLTPLSAVDGSPAGNTITAQLDDGGTKQWNDIYSRWNLGDDGDLMVEVEVISGAVFPYGSILDGRGSVSGTSDPTTIMPVSGGSQSVVLLEVGRITGLNEFSGSASLHNHSSRSIVVRVDFYERGVPGISESQTGEIGPGQTVSWDDAVGDLVGRTGVVGALVFTVEGGGLAGSISGIGREFAIFSDSGEITGTAGQLMPGLTPADRLGIGETFHFLGLRDRNLPSGRERSHLGVLNLGENSVTMTVRGYDDEGGLEGTLAKTVRSGEQLRVNNVLKAIKSNIDGGLKRLEVTADGQIYALAYRVNPTGDPVTLQAFREASP